MRRNITLEPSQPSTESTPHEPPGENERKTLKPGKGYGLASLRYGLAGPCLFLIFFLIVWIDNKLGLIQSDMKFQGFAIALEVLAYIVSPYLVIAGIVSGILGRNTEGRVYAYTGIVFSIIYGTWVSVNIANTFLFTIFFAPPCC